jgi:hypothetical protein
MKIVEGGGQNKRSRQIRGIEKAEGKAKVGRRTRGMAAAVWRLRRWIARVETG